MTEFILPSLLLVAFVAAYLRVCVKHPPAIMLLLVIYSAATKTASCLYLELNTVYLSETAMYTYWTGATIRQAFFNGLMLLVAVWVMQIANRRLFSDRGGWRVRLEDPQRLRYAVAAASGLFVIQLLNVLSSPGIPYPGSGGSRQIFWGQSIRFPILRDILGILLIFVPAVLSAGLISTWLRKQRQMVYVCAGMLIAYVGFLLISGQKFNGLLVGGAFIVGPIFMLAKASRTRIRVGRWGVGGIAAIAVLLGVSAVGFEDRGISQLSGGRFQGMLYRAFALQGGVYFTADARISQGQKPAGPEIVMGDMRKTLYALLPSNLAEAYAGTGVNLAGSLPGNAALSFGFLPVVPFMAAYGALLGFICALFARLLLRGSITGVFVCSYLCLWTMSAYARGSLDEVISYKFALFAILLALIVAQDAGRVFEIATPKTRRTVFERSHRRSAEDR